MTAAQRQTEPGAPVTAATLIITATISVVALLNHDVSRLLTRDRPLLADGQWWRLVTPILVQPDGWGQFAFNLAGLAVIGAALQRQQPVMLWLSVYLTAGVGSIAVLTLLQPHDRGGGSSDCVAGLIGALATANACSEHPSLRRVSAAPRFTGVLAAVATAYSAFFCAYLTLLDLADVWSAMIAGDLAVAVALAARRRFGPRRTATGVLALVIGCGFVMAVHPDGHGIGLLIGSAIAAAVTSRRKCAPGHAVRRTRG